MKGVAALRGCGVKYSTVGKNDAGRYKFFVAVGMCAAAHSAGIVHYDAAHHTAADGSRVRTKTAAIFGQYRIHPCAHDSGLKGNGIVLWMEAVLFPVFTGHQKH